MLIAFGLIWCLMAAMLLHTVEMDLSVNVEDGK